MNSNHPPGPYLASRIKEALATDERTNLLDVHVSVRDARVFLIGMVPCEQRRAAAESVARDCLPSDMQLVNNLCVETYEATRAEPLD